MVKKATATLLVLVLLCFSTALLPKAGVQRTQDPYLSLTDEQITAIESRKVVPPSFMRRNEPDTAEFPKPPPSRKTRWTKKELKEEAWNAARTHGVHPVIFLRVVKRESHWKWWRQSPLKYDPGRGLTQIRCIITARKLGYEGPCWHLQIYPTTNLFYGAKYLRQLVDRYGDYKTALSAYYAGPKRYTDLARDRICKIVDKKRVCHKFPRGEAIALRRKIADYVAEVIPATDRVPVQFVNLTSNWCHERIPNAACIWRFGESYTGTKRGT